MSEIPKIIHWGCFGSHQLSPLDHACMETWRKILPDFEIKAWGNDNGPDTPFFRDALKKKPVNCSNYLKYWALAKFGGIFLDNDVEVLRPFDLSVPAFVGFQRDDTVQDCVNTAVIGAVPEHPWITECLAWMDAGRPDAWPVWWGCGLPTETLFARGLNGLNVEQMVGDVMVYEKSRFYPWRWDETEDRSRITPETIAVHLWEKSWK